MTPAQGGGCQDEIKTTETGEARLIGFPISYKTTYSEPDNKESKPAVISMDVTEFEVLRLDAALFDIPAGMTQATDAQQLAKAISDANEARLAQGELGVAARDKKPGTVRVGVPEVTNKSTQTVDTRALRSRLVAELEEQKIDVIPMAAAPPAALNALANERAVDYLLIAEVTDLKVSKPGGLARIMKNTAGEGSGNITEAKLNVQLVPPGGKARLTKTTSGKDGGVGFKTGLGLAKLGGSLYLKMYMGGMYGQSTHGPEHDEDHEHRRDGQPGPDGDAGRPWPKHRRIGGRSHRRRGDVRHATGNGRSRRRIAGRPVIRCRAQRGDSGRGQGSR